MGILDRHKKPGGFRNLVNSLEMTPPDKRQKIIESMIAEDPLFMNDVMMCIFKFEEFEKIQDMVMSEILFVMKEFKTLAVALYKAPEALATKFTKNMAPSQTMQYREEVSMINQIKVSEQMGARFKIIEIARKLQQEGKFILKPYNSNYPET